ncbi:MAG: DUF2868 domain-containing protein [Desulfomicrobium sp.]|nr:DUF2868 domain-containing protein [Pseudomonadota bacterium]MBV1711010.1 DUF2868 domain-containing protein [Desulfomicrobium sp.]MBU4570664.1 DUF2868 domain-containing protein [Pseudomonadota bacterium]MBU4593428.1 DUF2868 domain-containing protein [Pseudomonadota bacterium]MBV1719258.1 DUF2868 domain-containing protein [Desulfomicrobium sp.]
MKHGMRLGDYLDLEWFLEKDRVLEAEAILDRDRGIGLAAQALSVPAERQASFWLERRREAEEGGVPSSSLRSILIILRLVLGLGGFLAGVSLVRALLLYSGVEPVNVSVFLLLAVLPQAGLCFLGAGLLVLRGLRRKEFGIPLRPLFDLFWRRPGGLSPQAGFVRALFLRRGRPVRMLGWESLRLAHLGGLCLALGSLAGMTVSVAVTDLAFGWQSTLQVGAQGMHSLVSALAAPWSWLPAQWGMTPTLTQIEGSRIILKDGMQALASADLAAWWPFLCMCLLVYALLPRLVLLLGAHWMLRRVEGELAHPDLGRIVDRMRSPLLGSARMGEAPSSPLPLDGQSAPEALRASGQAQEGVGCVLLLPPELVDRIDEERLLDLTVRVCGYPAHRIIPATLDPQDVRQALDECADFDWIGGHERFVALIEAWQPPIRENLQALKLLGQEEKRGRSLVLVLCGRPSGKDWLTAPDEDSREAWNDAVARLAPLRVDIFGASS